MGPLFFRAENVRWGLAQAVDLSLQWGRSFSERRTVIAFVKRLNDLASMGPLFFRAENL